MAAYNKFQPFVENLAEKVFNLGTDQLTIALTNTLPSSSAGTLASITQISYTNLSSRNITTVSSVQSGGTYKLTLQDLILTASGSVGPFRYVVIYDDTATNDELIAWADYGSSITMTSGDAFTIDFDGTNGLFTLA